MHSARLGSKGRLLVRPSGTENLVRVMAEGDDIELIRGVVDDLCGILKNGDLPLAA